MREFIRGKKTYFVAVAMIGAVVLKAWGYMDGPTYEALMGVLAALGFGALRAGVEKAAAEVQGVCSQPEGK